MNLPVEPESMGDATMREVPCPTSTTHASGAPARERRWLHLALQPPVVRRALGYAAIVGAILIVINHSDALLSGDISAGRLGRMLLTAAVPYVVSTLSSVGAMRQQCSITRESGLTRA